MLGPVHRGGVVLTAAAIVLSGACSGGGGGGGGGALGVPGVTRPGVNDAVVAPAPSRGCAATPTPARGEEKATMTAGATERWYLRHVPPAYDGATPQPLVVDLHGYTEGAVVHATHSALGAFGDKHGFVTVTPHGLGAVPQWDAAVGSSDVAFIGTLLDHVEDALCIDEARVFVTGLSNGAMMTSVVACELADRVAAVAPVAGAAEVAGCKPARAVPVVAFHGTADPFLAYDGGLGPAVAQLPAPDGSGKTLGELGALERPKGPSVPDVMQAWARRNRCAGTSTEDPVAADVTALRFGCPAGAEVELYRVQGGGHSWPGSAFSKQIQSVVGPTTNSISANQIMWDFFRAHPLPEVNR
jgi:polyhydroxybutyrate depolymerase